ncbi:hypothetical protein NliqN6_5529 [Naganishia liquefaciens]|uniref:Uncharacterized protein n=1 Tax=Naganishia liquefaciens TaxID=104408 RepID=A0A8H3YIE7_9TREE|nr:hypothetical protein NliqN6_5529 [Naganishia liquefaciens]
MALLASKEDEDLRMAMRASEASYLEETLGKSEIEYAQECELRSLWDRWECLALSYHEIQHASDRIRELAEPSEGSLEPGYDLRAKESTAATENDNAIGIALQNIYDILERLRIPEWIGNQERASNLKAAIEADLGLADTCREIQKRIDMAKIQVEWTRQSIERHSAAISNCISEQKVGSSREQGGS